MAFIGKKVILHKLKCGFAQSEFKPITQDFSVFRTEKFATVSLCSAR
jgi:hypothetical protein